MSLEADYIAKLEQENELLRERVRQLEQLLGMSFEAPPIFGFTPSEGVMFGMLLKNKIVRKEALLDGMQRGRPHNVEIKIVDVLICKMRRKLKPYGISIETQWGNGYFLNAASKQAAQSILDQVNA